MILFSSVLFRFHESPFTITFPWSVEICKFAILQFFVSLTIYIDFKPFLAMIIIYDKKFAFWSFSILLCAFDFWYLLLLPNSHRYNRPQNRIKRITCSTYTTFSFYATFAFPYRDIALFYVYNCSPSKTRLQNSLIIILFSGIIYLII